MPVDHYENFPVASLLLPRRLRRPIEDIYRFARSADDLADEGDASPDQRLAALADYNARLDRIERGETLDDPVFAPLQRTIAEWKLPLGLFRDLLDAFAQDVTTARYDNFALLLDYCRRSANPVGRLLLHLAGRATPDNLERSDAICSALQLANFWQDVAVDWRKGRVYLPQEDLVRFGVDEAQIAAGRCDDAWRTLIAFQTGRTRAMLRHGAPLVHELPGRMGWEIRFTVQGGLRILERIEGVGGDVFRRRPTLAAGDWLRIAARGLIM
jgi:squalene synthase HpnC